nr:hypothetical protein [Tanacetum cinerariifolium]
MCELACQIVQKKQEEKRIEEEQAAKARYWKIPACCDDDDDYDSAITPVLSTKEPIDSLSMGDEHHDTIPAMESDEVIKSSVEDLVPIPSEFEGIPDTIMGYEHLDTISATKSDKVIKSSVEDLVLIPRESEGIPDNMCDVPFRDNSPPLDISKDQFEDLSDSNDDSTSIDDDSFSIDDDSFSIDDIDYVEVSPPYSELISLEEVKDFQPEDGELEDDLLREKLSKINLLIAKIEALNFNSTSSFDFVLKSSIPKNSGGTTIHTDTSLLDLKCFYFKSEPDLGDLTSIIDLRIRENVSFMTNVNLPFEDDQSLLFAYVIWIFLPFLTYLVAPLYLLSFGNEDTIFDLGISIYHSFMPGVSHRNGTFMKFNETSFRASELNGLKDRNAVLEGQVEALESASVVKNTELESSNAHIAKLTQDLSNLQLSCDELSVKAASLESDKDKMIDQVSQLEGAIGRAINKGMQVGLATGIDHEKSIRDLTNVTAYDPFAEANYMFDVSAFRTVNFTLLSQLESHKDANIADLMGLLHLEGPVTETPEAIQLQPSFEQLMLPIRRLEDQVVIGETSLSFSLDVANARVQRLKRNVSFQQLSIFDSLVLSLSRYPLKI